MKKSRFIQGLTLLSFLFFMTAFVLYRSGKFDRYLSSGGNGIQTSSNGGSIKISPSDSIPKVVKDSVSRTMLSSSKSMIVFDQKYYISFPDSITKKKKLIDSALTQRRLIMSSSKSGPIFNPLIDPTPPLPLTLHVDHVKLDSSKKNE